MSCILFLMTVSMTLVGRHVMQIRVFTMLAPLYRPCLMQFFICLICDVVGFLSIPIHADILEVSLAATRVSNYACYVCSYGLCWH